ncbi:hypothetical protein [Pseudaquabacterium pictum]|uniref:Uncharacterized protein n=1 Tax=Pseudaquabacterium pictum TaxID=2315236 RepID=A0A480AQT7_9BURK|nr:hypothetical protein [Rubrivivax pictus]GCL62065.1 hypothetical protein AQPW35_11460 [Rubrivivax pictus]
MNDDPRCCGTGTCIINADGQCWCGQQWDGEKMCRPPLQAFTAASAPSTPAAAPASPPPPPAD